MDRRKFIGIAGGTTITVETAAYLLSDKSNLVRVDVKPADDSAEPTQRDRNTMLKPDEKEILFLASLAPSGHNTQPWFVQYLEPYHWIIGNDKNKWLPAVDPTQRETMLSIGTFHSKSGICRWWSWLHLRLEFVSYYQSRRSSDGSKTDQRSVEK